MAIMQKALGQVAVLELLICSFAGCGVVPGPAAKPSADTRSATCQHVSEDPHVGSDLTIVRSISSTAFEVDLWLRGRVEEGGPSVSLESFPQLKVVNLKEAMTVCLFRGPPRPVPGPKGNRTVPADGISVIADAAGDYQIDGFGPVAGLDAEVAKLTVHR